MPTTIITPRESGNGERKAKPEIVLIPVYRASLFSWAKSQNLWCMLWIFIEKKRFVDHFDCYCHWNEIWMEKVCVLPQLFLFWCFWKGFYLPLNKKEATSLLNGTCLFLHQKESSFFSLFPFNSFLLFAPPLISVEMTHRPFLASGPIRIAWMSLFILTSNVFIPDTPNLSIEPK